MESGRGVGESRVSEEFGQCYERLKARKKGGKCSAKTWIFGEIPMEKNEQNYQQKTRRTDEA